ncbi:TatD family hydrolase [Candidatus Uhrbacteria bacterium]|nr:TatD family hydrolase [Candidatus Uhrbacteria bacterium]
MLIDTHCHVHFNAYKDDMDAVIRRTLDKGVFMITVGTQRDTSANGLKVAELYDGLWASVGLHPNHLTRQEFWDDDELPPQAQATPLIKTRAEVFDPAYYLKLAQHPKCVAIGECGLDYYRIPEGVDREDVKRVQEAAVRGQFDVATQANLPVIVHCRDAHATQADLIEEFVKEGKLARRGVVHCFTGTIEEAQRYLNLGFYISFTGIITFPARKGEADGDGLSALHRVVREMPLERMLIETDAPYLTPIPHRGERNEPWYVEFVAQKVAELKGISFDKVAEQTTENARKLFGIIESFLQ